MRLVRSGLRLFVGLSFLTLPTATSLIRPAAAADKSPDPKRPYGLEKRVLWTTSRVQGSPDPASPFHTESAFPKLKFDEPIAMAHAPGRTASTCFKGSASSSRSQTARRSKKPNSSST